MLALSKKGLLSPFSWARKRIYVGTHLKKELIYYQGIPNSHRWSRKKMVNAFLMINITPI